MSKGLLELVSKGDLRAVISLADHGVDINQVDSNRSTALILAILNGRTEIAKELLNRGADPNTVDKNGKTAIMIASEIGHLKIAKELLNRGADPNTVDKNGKTAIMYALKNDHTEISDFLTAARIQENFFNNVRQGNIEQVKQALKQYKYLAQVKDKNGKTAHSIAIEGGREEIAQLFQGQVSNLFAMRQTRDMEQLRSTNTKGGGVSDTSIFTDPSLNSITLNEKGLSPKLIVKSTSDSSKGSDARDGNFEFILSRLYERLLPGKSPIYGLTKDKKGEPLITGQFFDGFTNLDEASKQITTDPTTGKILIENIEKVLTASVFGGEADAHWGNLGAKKEKTWKKNADGQMEEVEQYTAVKIDHGRSGYIMASNIEELTSSLTNIATTRHWYNESFALSTEKFAQSIKEVSQISEDEIENLLYSRIGELNKTHGKTYGDKSLDYIKFEKLYLHSRLNNDEKRIIRNKANELQNSNDSAADVLVRQFTKHAELFKQLDANIELLRKMHKGLKKLNIDKINIEDFFEAAKDPIAYARNNNMKIEGQDPLAYAIKNRVKIAGQNSIVYCAENRIPIKNLHPVTYALKHNIDIKDEAHEYIRENISRNSDLKKALEYLDNTRSVRDWARKIKKAFGFKGLATTPIYKKNLLQEFGQSTPKKKGR
ncbi:MAG: ankyrin repeat domain-containing protein [Rickettsiaceae bacterium]|nr:ankyrin repeat domain-containing protein [Rickettsiaceae bacterium]